VRYVRNINIYYIALKLAQSYERPAPSLGPAAASRLFEPRARSKR
jgi:hypothetical protein